MSHAAGNESKWEHRVALRNCGRIDPRDLDAYIADVPRLFRTRARPRAGPRGRHRGVAGEPGYGVGAAPATTRREVADLPRRRGRREVRGLQRGRRRSAGADGPAPAGERPSFRSGRTADRGLRGRRGALLRLYQRRVRRGDRRASRSAVEQMRAARICWATTSWSRGSHATSR